MSRPKSKAILPVRARQRSASRRARLTVQSLESRLAPATDVLTFHNDIASSGLNANETVLTPGNVAVNQFGKLHSVTLDGQAYAEPLVKTGVTIVDGPNTTSGAAGVHDVVFVATEHDSLYAIDASASGGTVLWQRTFLDASVPANNTLGASAIGTLTSGDVGSGDISPEIGITGTPVIDAATDTLYVVVKTKETIGGVTHFVQRLRAINIGDGTDRVASYLLGDTVNGNTNNTAIYVYGSGDGSVTDPYNGTGQSVVQFNALREHQRGALNLVNNTVYVEWASHGDNGPYHGLVAAFDVAQLSTTGFTLKGVLNTSPNNGLSGVWGGGGRLVFEPDGSAFYFETGNGSGGTPVLNGNGFPNNGNYNEALVKVVADASTGPTHQNINGWGLKVVDYFIPYNVNALDGADSDFGSGAPILLPDSAGIPGHPHLLIAGGKEGKLYVVDRNNLGHFDASNDNVLNSIPDGSGHNTPPNAVSGLLSTPAWFNGKLYAVSGYSGQAFAFTLGSNGQLTAVSQTGVGSFGYLPGSPIVSADGVNNGIVWVADRQANRLHAYDANTMASELWNTGQRAGGLDTLGAVIKFAVPTVANGMVYVGTSNSLVMYGQLLPPDAIPIAPTLAATALSGSAINLTWTDRTPSPNEPTSYSIEESLDGTNFNPVATAPAGARSLSIGGLQMLTHYYFQIRGVNALGMSDPSDVADAITTNQTDQIDFSGGFAGATGQMTLNGSAKFNGTRLELTDGGGGEAGSAFDNDLVDVTAFSSQFTFQLTNPNADGFTFTIQANNPTALGNAGGDLGYGGIDNSMAVKFDLYSNNGEGTNSTGVYVGGVSPFANGSINLTPLGLDLHSGDIFRVNMDYDGAVLTVILKDTLTGVSTTQNYTIDIPGAEGSDTAYVGFSGGTGGLTAIQDVLTWTFSPGASTSPNAPTGLGAVPASATSVRLNWSDNATNETGYHLDRATDVGFTQNVVTEVLPANPSTFTDTAGGLAPGETFYYRLRAFNTAGDSGDSNLASVTIPLAPPKPTDQQIEDVTTTEIDMSWQDNAGHQADGYLILRAMDHGSFTQVAALPPTSRTPPSTYDWSDTGLTPGHYYEYHIVAYNVSGNNDFAGVNATTITDPPDSLQAAPGAGVVSLSWTAPTGAIAYNVYRGLTPGGEDATPLATDLTALNYDDTSVTIGVPYYYTVTAVNANRDHVPVLPDESAPSDEATATPTAYPGDITGFTAIAGVNTAVPQVVLSWNAPIGATSYTVYRSLGASGEGATPIATGIVGTSYADMAVSFMTTYFYEVTATNSSGEGPRSAEAHATPLISVHVNFTSSTGDAVAGYLADTGAIYGSQSNGLKFGWTRNDTANDANQDAGNSPDELHDSFHNMEPRTFNNAPWHVAVPNGIYTVHIIAGDPTSTDGNYRMNVGGARTGGVAIIRGRPTAANPWIENTVTVTVRHGVLWVHNVSGAVNNKIDAIDIVQVIPGVNHATGFAGGAGIRLNGSARVKGQSLRLTNGKANQAGSAFTTTAVDVASFNTAFDFRLTSPSADGFAFVIQGVGPRAKGSAGGGLGYAGIANSAAIKFDLFDNNGEGNNSTGLYLNGASPTQTGSVDLNGSGIDLHSGHTFHAAIAYDGSTLTVVLTDAATAASASQSYALDLVGTVGSNRAYVGFTGGSSSMSAIQDILHWTYDPKS